MSKLYDNFKFDLEVGDDGLTRGICVHRVPVYG